MDGDYNPGSESRLDSPADSGECVTSSGEPVSSRLVVPVVPSVVRRHAVPRLSSPPPFQARPPPPPPPPPIWRRRAPSAHGQRPAGAGGMERDGYPAGSGSGGDSDPRKGSGTGRWGREEGRVPSGVTVDGDYNPGSESRLDSPADSGERFTSSVEPIFSRLGVPSVADQPVDGAQAAYRPVDERPWSLGNSNNPYSFRKTGSSRTPVAGTTTRVRQSVLYSNRPRRSGGRRGRRLSEEKLSVEEHAGEVSSSDSESSIIEVLPEFKALGLTGTPPKFQISPCWSNFCADDTSSGESDCEIVEENKPKEETDIDIEEERREMEKYFQENTCSTFRETCIMVRDLQRAELAAKKDKMPAAQRADMIARAPYFLEERLKLQAREQASREEAAMQILLRRQPRRGFSDKEIIQNANNWMSKEVMVAFDEYRKRCATFVGHNCQLVKLDHQCFNVENYCIVFHHFNFTVKIENPITRVSRVSLFFAELKEMFGKKYYFCSPLESDENGQCYACKSQGVNDLQHPATGGYDRGSTCSAFPYMYMMEDAD